MKTAIVLYTQSSSLSRQTRELNRLLNQLKTSIFEVELWLFYQDKKPDLFPDISCALSCIKLVRVENPHLPESFLFLLEQICKKEAIDLMLFTSDSLGEELATRLAYRLNGSSCLQVENCKPSMASLEVTRPAYGNNLTAQFNLKVSPYCLSVAGLTGDSVKSIQQKYPIIEPKGLKQLKPNWVKELSITLDQPDNGLADADIVLAVGQGVKNRETIEILNRIAASLGARLAASRPVVMKGWVGMKCLVGSSGLILTPKLCIAAGVSGAGAFSVGIKNSEFIIAINTDSKAPVFKIADVGIVDDQLEVLRHLENVINTKKGLD